MVPSRGVGERWGRESGASRPRVVARRIQRHEAIVKRISFYGDLNGHQGCMNTIHFNPAGDLLVAGSDDKTIIVWNWATKSKEIIYHSGFLDNVFEVQVLPYTDDCTIIASAADGRVMVGHIMENGQVTTRQLGLHNGGMHGLAIEEGAPHVFYSCGDDGLVQRVYSGHRNFRTVKGVNFFRPGKESVVSGSDCGHAHIWKKEGGKLLCLMGADTRIVNCVEPHPHDPVLATSGYDTNIKIWTPAADKLCPLPTNAKQIMAANKRCREACARTTLSPDVVMHVLRLQRRQASASAESRHPSVDMDSGEDGDDVIAFFR